MRAIKEELGDNDDDEDDVVALERKMQSAGMPSNIWKHAQRELRRLKKMQPQQPGYNSSHVYLELLADLPWEKATEEFELDLRAAKERLHSDHYIWPSASSNQMPEALCCVSLVHLVLERHLWHHLLLLLWAKSSYAYPLEVSKMRLIFEGIGGHTLEACQGGPLIDGLKVYLGWNIIAPEIDRKQVLGYFCPRS